jgi:glycine oxidase
MILVAGAGVFGSSIALALAQAGAEVTLADPAAPGDNASGVAAGMLAPAFEAALDAGSADHFPLLRDARDRWPAFVERLGGRDIGLTRSGAVWLGAEPGEAEIKASLSARGAAVARRDGRLFTPEDWRLDPRLALAAIQEAAREAGARIVRAGATGFADGRARLGDGLDIGCDRLVLAIGANSSDLAPELAHLTPISGQILQFDCDGYGANTPTARFPGGYRVDTAQGVVVGATMEPGRIADPGAALTLKAKAVAQFPELAAVEPVVRSGVRAATPDGLPMVGPSCAPNVVLAVGARRNGWLLAPLVAEMTAAYLAGADPGGHARAFDPRRFD